MALTAYEQVKMARDKDRPTSYSYINSLFEDFTLLCGDRRCMEDKAVVAGIAMFEGIPVTIVALEKGIDTKEKVERNFGCAHPEGYRKSLRLMKQAEKFSRPVICFVDTAGAFCGIAAEERGQGQAIAENLMEMMTLKTPVLSILIGEGGSGGALALAVADQVWMMENSVYSVISPEGCASILWKDSTKVEEAAKSLKLTANDLFELGVIEKIVPFGNERPTGSEDGASRTANSMSKNDNSNDNIMNIENINNKDNKGKKTKKSKKSDDSTSDEIMSLATSTSDFSTHIKPDFSDKSKIFEPLREEIRNFLTAQIQVSPDELVRQRYHRYRKIGSVKTT
jgi:acetyl-CoA carboxylase carboxyl transferase subunit alpha